MNGSEQCFYNKPNILIQILYYCLLKMQIII